MTNKLIIYTDGGSRGNPGHAAIGYVIYDFGGKEITRFKHYLGITTNNQAEYRALIAALEEAAKHSASEVVCNLDSELVVKQLQGSYKIREEGLKPLAAEALRLSSKFARIEFNHIPREKNKLADQLVNEALDEGGF
jgi:ribonuclease HI